jgi:CheY-like chemotaxis protein
MQGASTATVVVTDTGEGISADFLPYVFDRFRQADSSASRRHGGLGLGLALTKQIVELHGGSIDVVSGGAGKGAEFSIRLPVADSLSQVAAAVRIRLDEDALRGISVLVVDDSADSREMIEVALRGYGAAVVTAESSDQALAALTTGDVMPHVLVSDIGMPGSDGIDFIRRIRTSPEPICSMPAVAVTAYADPEDRIRALAAGYQLHLAKPAEPALIAESILGLTRASRATTPKE